MSRIVDKIQKIPDVSAIKGCTQEQINEAQKELGITFPPEYIDYVRQFGCIDFGATEWTGLNIEGRLNTVYATKQEMSVNPDFPKGFFVLENLGIDAKRIVVDADGKVYILQYDKLEQICDSISGYLDKCLAKNNNT